jgi:hypothetical protein
MLALMCSAAVHAQTTGQCGYPVSLSASGFEAGEQPPYVELPDESTPLSMAVDYPGEGAVIRSSSLQVYGSLAGPANTGVTINASHLATTDATAFTTQLIALPPGPQVLNITATTLDGATQTITRNITVSPELGEDVQLRARTAGHFAPLRIGFDLRTQFPAGQTQIVRLQVDYNGDGIFELDSADASVPLAYSYDRAGAYLARAVVSFDDGNSATPLVLRESTFRVQMDTLAYSRQLLCRVYQQMKDRLLANQPASALLTLTPQIRPRFSSLWGELGSTLPDVAAQLGDIVSGQISDISADFVIALPDPAKPGAYLGFPLQFERTLDGVWRIGGM